MSLHEGERLGPYQVLAPLGAGGMGEVYLARDTRLQREVALKLLPAETADDPERLARFEREARAVAALNHPNIVTLYGIEDHGGRRVIVMERVAGRPLQALLEPDGLPLLRVLEIAAPLADALAAAHERGVVHRDLKPANVMLSDEGRVKVLDFGLAKRVEPAAGSDSTSPTETRSDGTAIVGTIPYMSPEQLRGQRIDGRSDIFSLGVMLYEMAAGRRPFEGGSAADVASAILRGEPPSLASRRPDLPAPFLRLVTRCLEKDPRQRVQSATDLRQQLQDLAEEHGARGVVQRQRVGALRWTTLVAGLGVLVALAGWLLRSDSRPAPDAAKPALPVVAVLPFDNLSADPSREYFVDGLHDSLITELAKLRGLAVRSRNSVMRYRGRAAPMRQVARELGVDALIDGSVLRSKNRVRITAQLIQGATDEHLWAESYDGDLEDVLALLNEVSRGIARQVQAALAPGAPPPPVPGPAVTPRVRPEAFDAYLRGRAIINEGYSIRAFVEALPHFERAVALDAGLAPAWGSLALSATVRAFVRQGVVSDDIALARDAARKATAIDPAEGSAYGALGTIELFFDWDFATARRDFERALALSPHDGLVRHAYADYLMVTGHLDESLEQVRLGRDANPASVMLQGIVLYHTSAVRRPEALRREARLTLERFPQAASLVHYLLGDLLWREGHHQQALEEYRLAMPSEAFRAFERAFRQDGPRAARLAQAERLRTAARDSDRPPDWFAIAGCYAEGGAVDTAFTVLDKAFAMREPHLLHLVADPSFDDLREDPRYTELLRRIGIPVSPLQ